MAKATRLTNGVVLRTWTHEEDEILRINLVDENNFYGTSNTNLGQVEHCIGYPLSEEKAQTTQNRRSD